MEKLRVLIADDHPLFRDGMRGLLSTQPDIEVQARQQRAKRRSS